MVRPSPSQAIGEEHEHYRSPPSPGPSRCWFSRSADDPGTVRYLAVLVIALSVPLPAQNPPREPRFDVVSIKSHTGPPLTSVPPSSPGALRRLNVTVMRISLHGLAGFFAYSYFYSPDGDPLFGRGTTATAPDTAAPHFSTALQEQLGLKLEKSRGQVDVLVIDHIERPTEN